VRELVVFQQKKVSYAWSATWLKMMPICSSTASLLERFGSLRILLCVFLCCLMNRMVYRKSSQQSSIKTLLMTQVCGTYGRPGMASASVEKLRLYGKYTMRWQPTSTYPHSWSWRTNRCKQLAAQQNGPSNFSGNQPELRGGYATPNQSQRAGKQAWTWEERACRQPMHVACRHHMAQAHD
jgi:hypothetical protein